MKSQDTELEWESTRCPLTGFERREKSSKATNERLPDRSVALSLQLDALIARSNPSWKIVVPGKRVLTT